MMEVRTKLRRGIVRRKCREINRINNIKIAKREKFKKITTILRKHESTRSAEEKAVLAKMTEEVRQVKYRLCQQQKIIERNKEVEDDFSVLKVKCKKLANALQHAKHLVVYTGAGISTAADIPDYRGPNGIWTLLQQGKKIGKHDLTKADPTSTHMALSQLYRKKYLKFVVSQNCDGLHLRSGLPKRALSEVHGNMYVEMCKECKPNVQYWRLFDTTERTARFYHKTGRICHKCGTPLVDSIVHFGEKGIAQWPLNWAGALHHAAKADVILCLGSSLKVLKRYPWLWAMDKPVKKRPAIFIVNLQWTPKDHIAELKINGRCDRVMNLVMEYIGLEIPKYDRFSDPIFAHSSLLCSKELHTTTQPILVKPDKSISECENENCETKQQVQESGNLKIENKQMEIDEDEDDCPLKILKEKMVTSIEARVYEEPEDLTLPKVKNELSEINNISDSENKINIDIKHESNDLDIKTNLIKDDENSISKTIVSENKVDKTSLKVNCTVDLEENTRITSTAQVTDFQSNVKINAIINNGTIKTNSESSNKDINSHNTLEGISMEILAEEFERVHVEMKTNENEIHKVSILLVNKSKTPPKKCDKAQQTDPEPLGVDLFQFTNIPPDFKHFDTGQSLCTKNENVEIKETVNVQNHINLETKNVSSHIYINSQHFAAQVSSKNCKISPTDINKVLNLSCNLKMSDEIQTIELKGANDNKLANPLRSFRRSKEVKKILFKEEKLAIINNENEENIKSDIVKNETIIVSRDTEKPIDYSIKVERNSDAQIIVPKFYYPEKYKLHQSFILKIPKPPVSHLASIMPVVNAVTEKAIDLSVNNKMPKHFNLNFRRPKEGIHNRNVVKSDNMFIEKRPVGEYENFTKQCEILAQAIIENTLQTNHRELKKAYSGFHSIINPIPFNVQYDFQTVFNALNFINFGEKLISKARGNVSVLRRSSRTSARSDGNKSSSSTTSNATIKRKCRNRTRFTVKRDPNCTFCYENYKSVVCCFYTPHNGDDRFIRYENNKPYMCFCCGDSESSSSESDDDISLMERKRRLQDKTNRKLEENDDDKKESQNIVLDESIDENKTASDTNSKVNGDLKDGVQDNDESCENKDENVQAGWFGKGYRKNRRRKR